MSAQPTQGETNAVVDAPANTDPVSHHVPAWKSARAWAVLIATFGIALSVDLFLKEWSFRTVAGDPVVLVYEEVSGNPDYRLPLHSGIQAIEPDILDFRLVLNHGAVFGLGQGRGTLFTLFTIVAIGAALYIFGKYTRAGNTLAHVGIALVLAGGAGNMYDRITVGAVRDFLYLFPRRQLPWGVNWPGGSTEWFPWVFNAADVELISGMILLMLAIHLSERRVRQAKPA